MIERIEEILAEIPGVFVERDRYGNIFATKGRAEYYPLVCCHTDTVHEIEDYTLVDFKYGGLNAIKAINTKGEPSGVGGDNKTGIFICLELLRSQDILKAAFFVGEENGCYGSTFADPERFQHIAYCLEFDAPDYYWVTERCNGAPMFDPKSDFWEIAKPIVEEQTKGQRDPFRNSHPYTDVFPLKAFYDFPCLNYSSGYLHMHTPNEVVVLNYVFTALKTAQKLLTELGTTKHTYIIKTPYSRDTMIFVLKNRAKQYNYNLIKFPEVYDTV